MNIIANPTLKSNDYYARIIRAEAVLPKPVLITFAGQLPGYYLRRGQQDELLPGDAVLEGEDYYRDYWRYQVTYLTPDETLIGPIEETSRTNAAVTDFLRSRNYNRRFLTGYRGLQHAVRLLIALREGYLP